MGWGFPYIYVDFGDGTWGLHLYDTGLSAKVNESVNNIAGDLQAVSGSISIFAHYNKFGSQDRTCTVLYEPNKWCPRPRFSLANTP